MVAGIDEAIYLEALRMKQNVPMSRVLVDEDGIGGGVVDALRCKGFARNARQLENKIHTKCEFQVNYANLRPQCYYTLAEYVQAHKLKIESEDYRDTIIADLEQIKAKDPDKDSKLRVISKDEIKEHYGRSPDYGDALMMRMYFEIDPTPVRNIR
jgi:phage terminase large subunit